MCHSLTTSLRCVLQSFDKDGSGELDQYELRELLAHLGVEEGDVGRVMEQIMLQFNAVSQGWGWWAGAGAGAGAGASVLVHRACCVVHAVSCTLHRAGLPTPPC